MQVVLPNDYTRCRPGCAASRDTCARFQAPLGDRSPVSDFTLRLVGAYCVSYISVSSARAAADIKPEPKAKDWPA